MPESPFLPPRLRGRGYRSSRYTLPAAVAPVQEDSGGGGFLGTGLGPDVGLGLGNLFSELGQGVTGLARLGGHGLNVLVPGADPIPGVEGGPGFREAGKGLLTSATGTLSSIAKLTPGLGQVYSATPLEELLEGLPAQAFGEEYRAQDIMERAKERGILPALVEDIGNVSLGGAAVTAPVRAASAVARLAGAPTTAARLAGVHGRLIANPAIRAVQHPYRTAGSAIRAKVITPTAERYMRAQGIAPRETAPDFPGDTFDPVPALAAELPDIGVDYSRVRVDEAEHARRAKAYEGLAPDDPAAHPAFDAFRTEITEQYRHLTEDLGVKVEVVDSDPYPTVRDMAEDLRTNKRIKVLSSEVTGGHPFLSNAENDMFRAVHDAYGHAGTGRGFGRHGEEAAFLAHQSMFGTLAARAMATETRGQNAAMIAAGGEFAPQKVGLLPDDLADPTAAIASAQRLVPGQPVGRGAKLASTVENWLKSREGAAFTREQTRIADQERMIAARSPAIRSAVNVARDQIITAGRAQGLKISRQEASLLVGDEIRTRLEATDLLEQVGVPQETMVSLGIRGKLAIPENLKTPELTVALDEAAALTKTEGARIREVLLESRKGTKGLEGLGAEDAMLPELTKGQKAKLATADKKIARAQSDVLARKIARQTKGQENLLTTARDKLGQIAEEAQRLDRQESRALAAFDHSRTFTPRAWRTPEGLAQTAGAIVEETLRTGRGATFDPHTGRFLVPGQTTGYAVTLINGTAVRAARDAVTAADTGLEALSPEHVIRLAKAYQDVYQNPGTLVGTWIDPQGIVHVDPSELVPKLSDALIKGAERGQEAVFSMLGDTEIAVPRHMRAEIKVPVKDLPSERTLAQEAARAPDFPEPPAGRQDFYRAGRKGQQALSKLEHTAAKRKLLHATKTNVERSIKDIEAVLQNKELPSQVEQSRLFTDAERLRQKVREELGTPSISRAPARWQPLLEAVYKLGDEAKTNPDLASVLQDLPATLGQIQELAASRGFDPAHVRDFTPKQVRRLVFGNMRLGLGREGLLHEVEAGTRKSRTRQLVRSGGVDRSVESFLAASVEATNEARTNAVISWVEESAARKIEQGAEVPEGWQLWDPARTYLLTGTELSADAQKVLSTAATESLIVPDAVVRTLDRFTKDFDHWAFRGIRKVTNPWRTLVLTLSPGWYTRNFVGNVILATAEGVSLKDWQAAWHSFKDKDEMGRFADIPFVQSGGLARETGVMADNSLIPRQGLREAVSEEGRIRGTAQQISRRLMRVNEVVDEFSRAAVYHRSLNKLNMTPEMAWKRASETLVDYQALSPFERSAVRSVLPFYSWQKGILKVTMNQAIDHPARTGIIMGLGRLNEEYIADRFGVDQEDVPEYYKHLLGGRNVRSYNPFADPSELISPEGIIRSMNPFVETAIRKGMGAPDFFPESYRVGFFGQAEPDVNVPGELGELVTRSPGGRILGGGIGPQTIGFGPIDEDALRSRILRSRRQIRGIPNPETGQPDNPFLPPRARAAG